MKTRRSIQARRGFTLLEVIIALSIFVLLAAAVFGIFTATLESVAGLQDNQNQGDEIGALNAFLKKSFIELPADGILVSYHRNGASSDVSGVIWGEGNSFWAIDLSPQANGYYTMRITTSDVVTDGPAPSAGIFQQEVSDNSPSLKWRSLVRDVRSAQWRFRNAQVWSDQASTKPLLAELTIQLAGANSSVTEDFWVPPLISAHNAAVVAAASTTGATP